MAHEDNDDEYILTAEYAAIRRIKPQTARKERIRGDGPPFYKIRTRVLYRRGEVLRWIDQHRVTSTGEAA
jgi:hypothetical protein